MKHVYTNEMPRIKLGKSEIDDYSRPYVIAEIGHNHQGNLENALKLIESAAECGVSAVKFQKRDNKNLFSPSFYDTPYNSENAFGETYGLHREFLEFGIDEYKICQSLAQSLNLDFFATPFDIASANFLENLEMPFYKIASGDLQNLPLLEHVGKFGKPIIISTGGSDMNMISRAVETIRRYHNRIVILQCTASYPAKFEELNLNVIATLRMKFPELIVGFSGHDNGIAMSVVAYALGARVIEKHFTLNRTLKGTDHAFSLEPQGMKKLVRDLERASLALGDGHKRIYESEREPIRKMGKMIVASRDLPQGKILEITDLEYKSPAHGLPPASSEYVVGKKLKTSIRKNDPILLETIE